MEDNIEKPGIGGETFKIQFKSDWIRKDDILQTADGIVLTKPKKLWYKLLLQYISFGMYQAPWEYAIKLNNEKYEFDNKP